jgi:uncharacterized protein YPO0396
MVSNVPEWGNGIAETLFPCGQIRLAELSVFNWGSFHGLHSVAIDPGGTLITGDNGAGKSTLVDGLMALLQPAGRVSFNVAAAQGDRSDRTLMSYVRGNFGSEHEGADTRARAKREGATASGVRACYRADDGSEITLAAMFWITQASNSLSDLKRHYLVATRNVTLLELLQVFGDGDVRALKQRLRDDPSIHSCDDRFREYQEMYRRLLHMENRNAPALLSRALGLKKIDDLTVLIRELVLEPSRVRDDARSAVREFDDLRSTHDRLVDARRQHEALAPLADVYDTWRVSGSEVDALGEDLSGLPGYFGELCQELWQQRTEHLDARRASQQRELDDVLQRQREAEADVESRHADYLSHGGERIESLRRDIDHATQRLAEMNERASRYQQAARALGLDPALSSTTFEHNRGEARRQLADAASRRKSVQGEFGAAATELGNIQVRLGELQREHAEIERRPDSNIDPRYQRLRDEMAEQLAIPAVHLMFLGELIDVDPEQHAWQGAIERALGGLRTTLSVPEKHLAIVTRWLNGRHTGLHVRAQVVRPVAGPVKFRPEGFLRKLQWRKHPYRDWLKHHLSRFDLDCVAGTLALDGTPYSMTREGLIHREHGRFEKRDTIRVDDRRGWSLGFSNTTRLALLATDIGEAKRMLHDAEGVLAAKRDAMDGLDATLRNWERIDEFPWTDLDAPRQDAHVRKLHTNLATLESEQGTAAQAKRRWDAAKAALEEIESQRETARRAIWETESAHARAIEASRQAADAAKDGLAGPARERLRARVGELKDEHLESAQALESHHRQQIQRERDGASRRQQEAGNRAVGIVSHFRGQWELVAGEWAADLASVPRYVEYLDGLVAEGLPSLVDEFRARLNRHATQSLAGLREKIESERDDIRERIDVINHVLRRTEFREGTYLRLQSRREQYPHVKEFDRQLRLVFEQATAEDDPESRFAQLLQVIGALDKASNPTTAHTLESLRLLDPRYQMSFFAEEVNREDDMIRDVLTSSSGKSGGEKEAFAGTIVAASLAYVLTPDGADRPVYCTVFLDEAFSNTAEAVSRRVLRVFRELNVHVNLITPFKNLNLARESARSLIIAERDMERHESRLCEVTWEEVDRRLEQAAARAAMNEASALGVELEAGP